VPYVTTIPVTFFSPRHVVYEALTDLGNSPLWINGILRISITGRMSEGLRYHTENLVVGSVSRYNILVNELVPDERIVLVSESGLISFRMTYQLSDQDDGGTKVVCILKFAFENFVLNLARPAVESMAKARIQSDLETLKTILSNGGFGIMS
jgi:uncharacterized protein YndB with AHSA1/START domain